jgi:hypothetical protein
MEIFRHGETVRLGCSTGPRRVLEPKREPIPFGTPSQRRELWVVDSFRDQPDCGLGNVTIARSSDPDSLMVVDRDILIKSTVLDLMAARLDESKGARGE